MPANDVRDRDHADENRLVNQNPDLGRPGGSQADVDQKFADLINNEYSSERSARILRDQLKEAEGKKDVPTGGGKHGLSDLLNPETAIGSAAKLAATKAAAKAFEKADDKFFNPDGDKDDGSGKKKKGDRGKLTWKRKAVIAGTGGLVGLGSFFGLISLGSGPLAVIHFGQLLEELHMDDRDGQNQSRLMQHVRFMVKVANVLNGTPERNRLGYLGNKYVDKIDTKFKAAGVEPARTGTFGGLQTGYTFDPEKYAQTEGINNNTPEGVKEYLERTHGITTTITTGADGKVRLLASSTGVLSGRRLMTKTFGAVGWAGSTVMPKRFAAMKAGWALHPLRILDRLALQKIDSAVERAKKFTEDWAKQKETGTSSYQASGTNNRGQDEPDKGGFDEESKQVGQISEEGTQAKTNPETAAGKTGPLEAFSQKLSVRFTMAGAGAVAALCMLQGLAKDADNITMQNIGLVRQRIAVAYMAVAGQIQHGDDYAHNSPLNEEQVETVMSWLYDANTHTNATDARSLSSNMSGPDLPEDMKMNPDGNAITRFLSTPGIGQFVNSACDVVNSPGGTAAITILSIATGPVSGPVGVALGLAIQQSGLMLTLAKWLAGAVVPPVPEGALLGNISSYGARDAGSLAATITGGTIQSPATEKQIQTSEAEFQKQEFQEKSLATRLFDIQDRRSLVAQVYDKTFAPTPEQTLSKFANGFMNIGRNTFQSFGSLITGKASAAMISPKYTFDTPYVAHSPDDLVDPRIQDPYKNADAVTGTYDVNGNVLPGILDGPNGQMYKDRISKCFGVALTTVPNPDNIREMLYDIQAPAQGNVPSFKDQKENNCNDSHLDWIRVRTWVWDQQLANGWGCIEGDTQACQSNGITASNTTATGGGSATSCSGPGNGGGSITGPGPLNDLIPANPVIDPISTSVVSKFPKPAYANLEAYGVTVVCSDASAPAVSVSSGNLGWNGGKNPFDVPVQGASGQGTCNQLHIPADTHIPSGTDGWVVVIDSTKPGLYCEMWVAKKNSDTNWSMEFGGVYNLNGGGMPVLTGSGSGSNIPQSPILASEIEAGVINHALAFASPLNNSKFRPPASKTDGGGSGPFEEGMRFQLDPTFNCNTISGKGEKAVCVALQKYGAYNVDNTGGGTGFFFQSNGDPAAYQAAGITGDYMKFNNIPMDQMRLLKSWQGN